MNNLRSFVVLFRWPNLLMLAGTQALFRYFVLIPLLAIHGVPPGMTHAWFLLLLAATLMLAAAGYAINDYFDLRTDRINKPHRMVVGRHLSRAQVIFSHKLLNITGFSVGILLAVRLRQWLLMPVFAAVPALLWAYAIRYKRRLVTGNLIVSLLAALVILLVWYAEMHAGAVREGASAPLRREAALLALFYAGFALVSTFLREVIKDMQDLPGDLRTGCRSIPIAWGLASARRVVAGLALLLLLMTGGFQVLLSTRGAWAIVLWLALVQVLLLILLAALPKSSSVAQCRRLQLAAKAMMLAGILSMAFFPMYYS
jgi:4-hydroxybenzoate polyprenyltransferase